MVRHMCPQQRLPCLLYCILDSWINSTKKVVGEYEAGITVVYISLDVSLIIQQAPLALPGDTELDISGWPAAKQVENDYGH